MTAFDEARHVLHDAIARRVFPAAAVDVGSSNETLWRDALGTLTFDPDAFPATESTPFDLASLTKVIATTTVLMEHVRNRVVRLDERVADCFGEWRGADRESVTVQDLLEHASGLPARLLDAPPGGRREFEHEICTMPLEYEPRRRSVYSDLGFILLGFVAADRAARSLAAEFDAVRLALARSEAALASEPLTFGLSVEMKRQAAPTVPLEHDPRRGRRLVGDRPRHLRRVSGRCRRSRRAFWDGRQCRGIRTSVSSSVARRRSARSAADALGGFALHDEESRSR